MRPEPGAPQPDAGMAVPVSPLVRRVLAPNPSALTGRGTNTYVVGATPPYTVIDPGPAGEAHLAAVMAAAPSVGAIVVTHTHSDHSPGAAALTAATGAPVCGFGPMLRAGVEGHDDTFRADRVLGDGDVVGGADHRLVALHTPGHASNHLCFLLEEAGERVLFTGDHVMEGSTVVIAPLDGDMGDYLAQLRRLRGLRLDRLLPGHGEPIDDPDAYLQGYLDHRTARTLRVLAALQAAGGDGATCAQLVEHAYTDVDPALHPIALYTVWATLRATPGADADDPDAVGSRWRMPEQGGDPACWLDQVCDACGQVHPEEDQCPGRPEPVPVDAAGGPAADPGGMGSSAG